MVEVFALVLYSVQWLGVVLGVGAETVLLVAHLMARHEHRPQWLSHVPGVRGAQSLGFALIVASGAGAVWYHLVSGQVAVLLMPTFGFKWLLIGLLGLAFALERSKPGRALIEGFAGATWYALFLVHSVAPVAGWGDLAVFYGGWLLIFGAGWGAFVFVMKHLGAPAKTIAQAPAAALAHVHADMPKPAAKPAPAKPPPPPPKPKPIAMPAPISVPVPLIVATTTPHYSLRHRLAMLFARKPSVSEPVSTIIAQAPKPAPSAPKPSLELKSSPLIPSAPIRVLASEYVNPAAPKPAPQPAPKPGTNLPVIEYLELTPPAVATMPVPPPPPKPPKPSEIYDELPTIRVMPKSAEDLQKAGAAAMVQFT